MDQGTVITLAESAMILVLIVSLPPILCATFFGLTVSLLQALTQIQEQTLGFTVKLIAVIATLVIFGDWLTSELIIYTQNLFGNFPTLTR